MRSKLFRSLGVVVVMGLFVFGLNVFAATTDKDLTLDDASGDSPQVILQDEGDTTLTLQKMDAGEANIVNNEGVINLKPSNDTDDFNYFSTLSGLPGIFWDGVLTYTNDPGIRINSSGQLEYRDQNGASYTTFDSISGGATNFGDLSDVSLSSSAQGDIAYYNGSNWVNLGYGASGYYLQTQGASANPVWAAAGGGDITAIGDIATGAAFTATAGADGNTLYLEGTTTDAYEIALTGADPSADVIVTIPATTGTLYVSGGTDVAVADGGTGASNAAGAKTNLGFITDVVDDITPQLGGQLDVNGNSIGDGTLELLSFSETASAVNELTIKNAATGGAPELQATGSDTNIDLELIPKGTGVLSVAGTTNYEDNVSTDDDIPNKKWIDDQSFGTGGGDITAIGDIATGAAFTATAGADGNTLYLEGTTTDAYEIALTGADPSADVIVTIPATTGTLYVSGGTDVAVADGGTGASNAAGAKTNLGFITDVVDDTTPQLGGNLDVNGNSIGDGTLELLSFSETASAVNELTIKNAATGGAPELQATGSDTNIDLELIPKGTGVLSVAGTTNYEDNVSTDDDIPNKKWIDDQSFGTGGGDITAVGDIATGAAFTATAGADGNTLYLEGTTTDAYEIALTGADPSADVIVTIPATTGTLYVSGGTDVAVADGGTGASNAAGAKTNLGFITDVVDDTTPQLGGNLDVNGNNITSTAGIDIAIGASAGNDFTIDTNKLVVEGDSGNVGIGEISPTALLHLNPATASASQFRLETSAGTDPSTPNSGDLWWNGTNLNFYNGASTADLLASGSGDITAVGSMTTGAVFADSTATGDWLGLGASAGRIEFDDQATDEVNILSANVGIGTAAPTSKLYVEADTLYSGNEGAAHGINIGTGTAADDHFLHMGADKTNDLSYIQSIGNQGMKPLVLQGRGGNVGIGKSSGIVQTLSIKTSVDGDAAQGESFAHGFSIMSADNDYLYMGYSDTGNYGYIQAVGDSGVQDLLLNARGGQVGIGVVDAAVDLAIGDSDTGINQDGDGVLELWTNNADRLHITNTGDVGIGTDLPTARLQVVESGSAVTLGIDTVASFQRSGASESAAISVIAASNANSTIRFGDTDYTAEGVINYNNNSGQMSFFTNRTVKMYISWDGKVSIGALPSSWQLELSDGLAAKPGGGAWSDSSDERLKTNIMPIRNALDKITALQGVTFDWINPQEHDGDSGGGFIAQNVEQVFPEFINEVDSRGADKALTPDEKHKALSLPFTFNAYMVEAIKEQQTQIDVQQKAIAALEARLAKMER